MDVVDNEDKILLEEDNDSYIFISGVLCDFVNIGMSHEKSFEMIKDCNYNYKNKLDEYISMPIYDGKELYPDSDKEKCIIEDKITNLKSFSNKDNLSHYLCVPFTILCSGILSNDMLANEFIGYLFMNLSIILCAIYLFSYFINQKIKYKTNIKRLYSSINLSRIEYNRNISMGLISINH